MSRNKITNEKLRLITKTSVPRNDEEKFDGDGTQVMKIEGVSLVWKNLRVTAEIKTQHLFQRTSHNFKEIIHNVNGFVEPSTLVGILGASGSGKSTLMSVLANRHLGDLKVDGDVFVNGEKMQLELMRSISGFVYQYDFFIPTLTVSEHLQFAVSSASATRLAFGQQKYHFNYLPTLIFCVFLVQARLKLDKRITTEYRKRLVNELLKDVGLTKCANRLIGTSSYGGGKMNLSGGEVKRLSVATELLTNPSLLFCDEPTTGLDSFTALKVMTSLRKMTSERGKTIICSIHQPSENIFDLFHNVILLHNGKIAFIGNTKDALVFFQSIGNLFNEEQNAADYLVKNLAIVPSQEQETAEKASNICRRFEKSPYAKYIQDRIEQEISTKIRNYSTPPEKVERVSWFYMLYLLTYRDLLGAIRDPSIQVVRIINKAALGLILGIFMMGTTTMTQAGIQSLKGMIFTMVTENSFPAMDAVIDHFPNKMLVFWREYSNDMNTPLIFYLSNMVSLIPGFFIDPIVFTILMYTLLELRKNWFAFLGTITINVIVFNTAAAFGTLVSLATDSVFIAQSVTLTVGVFYMSFAGIFMNVRSISWIFSWMRYVSWMTYAVESLLILQYDGVDYIECSESSNVPCLKNGEEVLKSLGFDRNNLQENVAMICYIYLILQGLCFFTLKLKLYFKTNR